MMTQTHIDDAVGAGTNTVYQDEELRPSTPEELMADWNAKVEKRDTRLEEKDDAFQKALLNHCGDIVTALFLLRKTLEELNKGLELHWCSYCEMENHSESHTH